MIGSPGAGKSTFSRKLRDKTGLPLHYLDMMWHLPDRTTISKEEFDNRLTEILKMEQYGEGKEVHIFHSRDDAKVYLEDE